MKETARCVCQICKKPKSPHNGRIGELIRPSLLEFIKKQVPEWDDKGFICLECLGKFRKDYVKETLEDEIGELSALDHEVIESLQQHEILSENISKQFEKKLTFGERLSDRIAEFGGSWRFIILFGAVLLVWILANAIFLANRGFDPYPFILLNLILSCLAAIQAPIIMMSQNRAEVARPVARGERLQGQSESRVGDPASARENRPSSAPAVQSVVRDSADSNRASRGTWPQAQVIECARSFATILIAAALEIAAAT